jgi:hypothetical protein
LGKKKRESSLATWPPKSTLTARPRWVFTAEGQADIARPSINSNKKRLSTLLDGTAIHSGPCFGRNTPSLFGTSVAYKKLFDGAAAHLFFLIGIAY